MIAKRFPLQGANFPRLLSELCLLQFHSEIDLSVDVLKPVFVSSHISPSSRREKSEKRCLNPTTPSSVTSSGVARVPPTTHVGPLQSIRGNHAAGKKEEQRTVLPSQA